MWAKSSRTLKVGDRVLWSTSRMKTKGTITQVTSNGVSIKWDDGTVCEFIEHVEMKHIYKIK